MQHRYQRRAQFADTDAAGVVHFSRLLCYVEEAEHDLLENLGIPLLDQGGWPRVQVTCDYLSPVRVGDDIEVIISPAKLGKSSVHWGFSVTVGSTEVAMGKMKTVYVDHDGRPASLPESWRNLLGGK